MPLISFFLAVMILWIYGILTYGMTMELLLSVTVIAAVLLLVRVIIRGKVRATVMHGLWLLMVLRLLLCVVLGPWVGGSAPEGSWSVNRAVNHTLQIWQQGDKEDQSTEEIEPAVYDIGAIRIPLRVRAIWIIGSIAFLMLFAYLNERFRRKIYDSRERIWLKYCEYPIYQVPKLFSPCVLRIRREKAIYLTEELAKDEEKRKYVIAHETCHIKYHDLFWACVRNFVLACFWFHPLIWIAAIQSKRDNEIACDERAIHMLGESSRKAYGEALLDMVDSTNRKEDIFYLATTMTAGKKEIYHRIRLITLGAKSQIVSTLSALLICFVVVCTCFTTHVEAHDLDAEETIRQSLYYVSQQHPKGTTRLFPSSGWYAYAPSSFIKKSPQGVRSIKKEEMEEQMKELDEEQMKKLDTYAELAWYSAEVLRREEYYGDSLWRKEKNFWKKEYYLLGKLKSDSDWQILEWRRED